MSKKKGGILGAIRDAVLESAPEQVSNAPAGPVFGTPGSYTPSVPGTPTFTPAYTYSAPAPAASAELVAEVEAQLSAASSQEYTKFGALLAQMSQIPDERLRFTTALNIASTTLGLAPTAIRNAFEGRVAALDKIEAAFQGQSQGELQKRTLDGEAHIRGLTQELERRQAELTRLQQELAETVANLTRRQQQLVTDQQEIENVRQNMTAALAAVRAKVTAERDTVLRNIGG